MRASPVHRLQRPFLPFRQGELTRKRCPSQEAGCAAHGDQGWPRVCRDSEIHDMLLFPAQAAGCSMQAELNLLAWS